MRCLARALALLVVLAGASPLAAQEYDLLMRAADDLWARRVASDENVEFAVGRWLDAAKADPKNAAPLCRVAAANAYRARIGMRGRDAAAEWDHVRSFAERALRADPKAGCGRYWRGLATLQTITGKPPAEFMKQMNAIEQDMEAAKSADAAYDQAGADRALGQLAYKAPIKDWTKAQTHLDAALKATPDATANKLAMAQMQLAAGRAAEARSLLEALLADPGPPGFDRETAADKATASELLEKVSR